MILCADLAASVPPERRRWLLLSLAWAAQAIAAAVFLGIPAIAPQFAAAYDLGLGEMGLAFAALMVGAGVSVLPWGMLTDSIGEPRVMATGLGMTAASLTLVAAAPAGIPVAALLALAGVGSASASAAGGRYVVRWFHPGERGLAMGIRQSALPVGAAAAALILPVVAAGLSVAAAFAALAAASAVVAAAAVAASGAGVQRVHPDELRFASGLGSARLRRVVAASVLLAIPQLSLSSFLVVFLHDDHGWPVGRAAVLLAAVQLAGAAARPLIGRSSDRHGERVGFLARLAFVELTAVLGLVVAAPIGGAALVAAVIAAGVASLCWNGVAAAAAGDLAAPGRAGTALGWQTSAVFMGGVAAPGVALIASATSWNVAFAALAVPAAAAVLLLRADRPSAALASAPPPPLTLPPPAPLPSPSPSIDEQLARALTCMSSAVSLIDVRDASERLVYVNAAFERLTGYDATEAVGRTWTFLEGPETDHSTALELREAIGSGHELRVCVRHYRQNRQPYWSETFMSPVVDAVGTVTHFIAVQKDVTARTEAERRAAHLAYHDALTGLPNRTQLHQHLALALARARRGRTSLALLFMDLDGFKLANDHHGHDAGDQVLRTMAERWIAVGRDGDVLARHGGDEFVLLMSDLAPAQAHAIAAAAAGRYVAAARLPFPLQGRADASISVSVSVSIGIALYPDDGHAASELLVAADAAMYEAKLSGGAAPVALALTRSTVGCP